MISRILTAQVRKIVFLSTRFSDEISSRRILGAVLLLSPGLGATVAAAEEAALSYAEAQARLVAVSDALDAKEAAVRAREAQEGATQSLRRPDVDVEAQLLEYQMSVELPLGPLAPIGEHFGLPDPLKFQQRKTGRRPIATATLPLYSGGKIPAAQAGARAQVEEAEADWAQSRDDQLLMLAKTYYGQILAAKAFAIRRDVLAGLERHVRDATKLEREGFISRAQRLQAEVARDEAAREVERARSGLATADMVLAGLLRLPEGVRPVSPLAVDSSALEPAQAFVTMAMGEHPQLERFDSLSRQAAAGVELQKSELRPNVYAFGQYNFDRSHSLLTDPDWSVGVGVRYKLIGGKGRRQMVEAAEHNVRGAEAGRREAETQIRIGVTKYWNEAESARRRFALYDSAIASAQENLRLQQLSYRAQLATSLDVVDAELGLGRAQTERAQAAYDYISALADLLHAAGQIEALPEYLSHADRVIS